MRANIIKVLSGNTIAAGLSFLMSVALARLLSVEDFGEVSYAFTVSMMLAYLVGGGVGSFSVVAMPRAEDKTLFTQQINGLLAKASGFGLLAAVPVITAVGWLKGAESALFLSAIALAAMGMIIVQQTFSLHQANGQFGAYSKQQALTNLARAIIVLATAVAVSFAGSYQVVTIVSASAFAFIIVAIILIFKYNNYWKLNVGNHSFKPRNKDLKHMVTTACVIAVASRIDQLIGKELLSPEAFGQYALASTLALAFTLLQAAFMSASLHASAQGATWEKVRDQQKKLLPWLAGTTALVLFVAQWGIPFAFGDRYAGSVPIFQVLAMVTIFSMMFTPVETFVMVNDAKAVTHVKLLQVLGAVGLGIGAGFIFGAVGVAVAVLLAKSIGWAKLQYKGIAIHCKQQLA